MARRVLSWGKRSVMTWASRFFDDECREYALRKLDDVEYFLLGRKAYEALVPAWTTVTGNAYIDRINGLKKLVASTTLGSSDWHDTTVAASEKPATDA